MVLPHTAELIVTSCSLLSTLVSSFLGKRFGFFLGEEWQTESLRYEESALRRGGLSTMCYKYGLISRREGREVVWCKEKGTVHMI